MILITLIYWFMSAPNISVRKQTVSTIKNKTLHQHQKKSRREAWLVPFCCREAPCSLPSASPTCSVPWSPAAVTWFPSRQYRSSGPSAQPVYSHDASVKSKVYPAESRARARGESMMERSWSGGRGGEPCALSPPLRASLSPSAVWSERCAHGPSHLNLSVVK